MVLLKWFYLKTIPLVWFFEKPYLSYGFKRYGTIPKVWFVNVWRGSGKEEPQKAENGVRLERAERPQAFAPIRPGRGAGGEGGGSRGVKNTLPRGNFPHLSGGFCQILVPEFRKL